MIFIAISFIAQTGKKFMNDKIANHSGVDLPVINSVKVNPYTTLDKDTLDNLAFRLLKHLPIIATAAGQAIIQEYENPNVTISQKPDGSPVTSADLASDEIIRHGLAQAFPEIALVTEESFSGEQFPPKNPNYFLIDPLDGTKEFIKRSGEFAINIGLIIAGQPCFGVIWHPLSNSGYIGGIISHAHHYLQFYSGGKMINLLDPSITVNAVSVLSENLLQVMQKIQLVVSPMEKNPQRFLPLLQKKLAQLQPSISTPMPDLATTEYRGSSLKFFALLEGSARFYPRFAPSYEWDIAAGHALLRGLNGHVEKWDKDYNIFSEMDYGKKNAFNGAFLAYR